MAVMLAAKSDPRLFCITCQVSCLLYTTPNQKNRYFWVLGETFFYHTPCDVTANDDLVIAVLYAFTCDNDKGGISDEVS